MFIFAKIFDDTSNCIELYNTEKVYSVANEYINKNILIYKNYFDVNVNYFNLNHRDILNLSKYIDSVLSRSSNFNKDNFTTVSEDNSLGVNIITDYNALICLMPHSGDDPLGRLMPVLPYVYIIDKQPKDD